MEQPNNIVIVGAGHAAGQFVQSLKQQGFAGHVTLIGDEPQLPYQRPPLSKKFLAGELTPDRLLFKPASAYSDVETRLGTRAQRIDRRSQTVHLQDGATVSYDQLVLALGSRPRVLPIEGSELAGVFYLRTIEDVQAIRASIADAQRVAIVGAGYIGLEVAAVLRGLGHEVVVIEAMERVMSRVVSPQVSAFYEQAHRAHGVQLRLSTAIDSFAGGDRLTAIKLADGETVATDAVVVGVGVEPNVELAAECELTVDNGIAVDASCRTSDPCIFAIGDCTSHPNPIYERRLRLESVHNALEQAKTAAANACGQYVEYGQVPWFWSDQYDLKLQIAGLSSGYDNVCIRGDVDAGSFACLYLRGGRLLAIDAVNRPKDFMQAKPLIAERARINAQRAIDAETPLKEAVLPAG